LDFKRKKEKSGATRSLKKEDIGLVINGKLGTWAGSREKGN
jgi:hypothetical protein